MREAWPLYAVVMPTMKNTTANTIATVATRETKCAISTAKGLLFPDSLPVSFAICPMSVWSPVRMTTVPVLQHLRAENEGRKLGSPPYASPLTTRVELKAMFSASTARHDMPLGFAMRSCGSDSPVKLLLSTLRSVAEMMTQSAGVLSPTRCSKSQCTSA